MMRASRGPALPLPPPSRCPARLAIYSRWWRERVIKIIDADGRHCSASSPLRMPSYTPRYTPRSTLPSPVPRTFLHAYFMPPGNYRFLLLLLGPRRHSPLSLSVVNVLYVLSYSTAFNHAACGFFSTFHLIFFFFLFSTTLGETSIQPGILVRSGKVLYGYCTMLGIGYQFEPRLCSSNRKVTFFLSLSVSLSLSSRFFDSKFRARPYIQPVIIYSSTLYRGFYKRGLSAEGREEEEEEEGFNIRRVQGCSIPRRVRKYD